MTDGIIEITRINRLFDKFRRYSILIDENRTASIGNNKTISFNVPAGQHTIYAKIDCTKSNKLQFIITSDQTLKFLIGKRTLPAWQYWGSLIAFAFCVAVGAQFGAVGAGLGGGIGGAIYGHTIGRPEIVFKELNR
jgi:hypothetical protein